MRLFAAGLAAFALSGCLPVGMMAGAGGIGTNPADAARANAALLEARSAGAAQASRPGDADMTCAQIQAELMAQMQDPKFQQAMGSMGARANAQKARQDAAMAGGKQVKPTDADARAPVDTTMDIASIMPQIMRGERLNELATAKKCPIAQPPPN